MEPLDLATSSGSVRCSFLASKPSVTVAIEIDILDMYSSIENSRFEKHFVNGNISKSSECEASRVTVPFDLTFSSKPSDIVLKSVQSGR